MQGPGPGLDCPGPGQGLVSQGQDKDLNFVLKESLGTRTRTTTLRRWAYLKLRQEWTAG